MVATHLKVSHRTAHKIPQDPHGWRLVLHLGPHGRWAEVPTLQLLTEVQNLVSWAKSKILFLPQVPGGSGQFFPDLRGICEALLKLQRECLADGNAEAATWHKVVYQFSSEQLGAGNQHSAPTSAILHRGEKRAALPPLIPGEGTTKNRLTRTMTQCIQLKLLELRFVLKMGTSFLDYESATAEKQAEEHDEPRSQRAVPCFSTAAVPRKDRPIGRCRGPLTGHQRQRRRL